MYLQDDELYRLRSARDAAKQRQQTAWQAQQSAYERRSSANAIMNQAYEAQQTAYANQQAAWDAYMSVKRANGPRIDSLNAQQERAYQNMKSAFESASLAHNMRDGASARMYADQGHAYKAEAQDCVAERRQLVASSLKFAPHASGSMPSNQLSKRLRVSLLVPGRHFSLPKQSTNVRKLNLRRQRLSLMIVPRRSRIGSMN